MKKLLLNLCACTLLFGTTRAEVVLNEPFAYADGPLDAISGGLWNLHSGTTNQVEVESGKARLTQSESEDVNALLAGRPHATGNLYASFVLHQTGLPNTAGGYFAHFKRSNLQNFRARIFTSTSGAAAGQFRVGIAGSDGAAVMVPKDLSLGQDYTVVVRYVLATSEATLWINPAAEGATTDRADATDLDTVVDISAFALRQTGGMGSMTVDDLLVGTTFGDVTGGNNPALNPPSISIVPDQQIPGNASTAELPLVVGDGETAAGSLLLTAASDNLALVPVESVVFGGSASNRTVRVTPAVGQQGIARVSVTVTDAHGNPASRSFRVTVGTPTISSITNQNVARNTISPSIPFTVGDAEGDQVTITVLSTNVALVPTANVTINGNGAERTVTIAPVAGVSGLTRLTLIATDGFTSVSNSFVVTVFSTLGADFVDSFDYPDGSLITNSAFIWGTHSAGAGQTGQTQVIQGRLALSSTQGEDLNAFLLHGPYEQADGWLLYARFTVNFGARPTSGGDYFAHFRGAASGFGGRVFAATSGAATGKFHLGVANSAGSPSAVFPADLITNVTYTVVTRLNVGTGQTTLWIDPAVESDASVTAPDAASPFDVWTYGFRQSGGIGSLVVDDLKIATAFSDVVAALPSLTITLNGGNVQVAKPSALTGYTLQYKDDLTTAAWTDYTGLFTTQGDNSVVTFTGVSGQRFFRLVK